MGLSTGSKSSKDASGSSRSLVDAAGVLFDQQSTSSVSNEFEVRSCPIQLIAFDLADGDVIEVERVFELPGCDHPKRTVPVTSCCGACVQSLYRMGNNLVDTTWLSATGRYRLVYKSGTPGNAIVIMNQDPLALHRDLGDCGACACGGDICDDLAGLSDLGSAQLGLS